jgi:hypothetical protein
VAKAGHWLVGYVIGTVSRPQKFNDNNAENISCPKVQKIGQDSCTRSSSFCPYSSTLCLCKLFLPEFTKSSSHTFDADNDRNHCGVIYPQHFCILHFCEA